VSIKNSIRKKLNLVRSWAHNDLRAVGVERDLLLGRMASWSVRSRNRISSLQEIEFKVTSQWGEDGILDWLIERANIPTVSHSFIEFGVENYREANTRFLLQNRNWRGLIMDGSSEMVSAVKADGLYWKYDLVVKPAFIDRENINRLISEAGFTGDIGLLSVDLDGNDYWIWQAIEVVRPIICICEYNAVFGDLHAISVPYDPKFQRTQAHFSNLYFGASLAAFKSLATTKGYRFVGTTLAGNDAFFVREDYAARFVDDSLTNIQSLPSMARESRNQAGQLTYVRGLDRFHAMSALPVVNTDTGETHALKELPSVYSAEWLAAMTGSTPSQAAVQ
jgi:hypothetical protein